MASAVALSTCSGWSRVKNQTNDLLIRIRARRRGHGGSHLRKANLIYCLRCGVFFNDFLSMSFSSSTSHPPPPPPSSALTQSETRSNSLAACFPWLLHFPGRPCPITGRGARDNVYTIASKTRYRHGPLLCGVVRLVAPARCSGARESRIVGEKIGEKKNCRSADRVRRYN